jgi:hypothetical protein
MSADKENELPEQTMLAGKRLLEVAQVPFPVRLEAQSRWGANVEFNAARENGRYTGPVFAVGDYVAQKVSDQSVVIHRVDHMDFSTSPNMQKRADGHRLNDASLQIRYEGNSGKAFYHDPERAAIEEMFSRIKKTALQKFGEGPELAGFVTQLDVVKGVLVDKHREAKNRQFEKRTANLPRQPQEPNERAAPAQER